MFNDTLGGILLHIQVPYQCLLIRSADYPIVSNCERGPLYISHEPWEPVAKMARRIERGVEIDDIKAVSTART
jgi:hypothetical protein